MNNENKYNEDWWNANPMTYEDWDESRRSLIDDDKFEKINYDYINENPYLNLFFDDLKNDKQEKTILDIGWLLTAKFSK